MLVLTAVQKRYRIGLMKMMEPEISSLRRVINSELVDGILPFHLNYLRDPEGGFYGTIANDQTVDHSAPKGLVQCARLLWTYARAYRVFTLLGDGELEEGSNWEASMSAAHYQLDNLVVIVDYNKLQITGPIKEVTGVESVNQKLEAFGYAVREVDGNNVSDLVTLFEQVPFELGKPSLILAHTTKGKGISFIENQVGWHHHVPSDDEYEIAMNELDSAEKEWWERNGSR